MAGEGKRFQDAGFTTPKPFLTDAYGKTIIERVVESLNIDGNYVFILREEHVDRFKYIIENVLSDYKTIILKNKTQGAACTVLEAVEYINQRPLIIANSDQIIEWNSAQFIGYAHHYDGCILTFNNGHPKWSYVQTQEGFVRRVAEKKVISNIATVGVYFWKRGYDFISSAQLMISANDRVNNEFYVCPTYNYMINDLKKYVTIYPVRKMYSVGTPEDYESYLKEQRYAKICTSR
jgi:dTDP-glucose pyrophosphorylase